MRVFCTVWELVTAAFILYLCALIPSFEDYQNPVFIQLLIGIKEEDFRFLITLILLKAHRAYLHVQRKLFQTTSKKFIKEKNRNTLDGVLGIKKILLEMKDSFFLFLSPQRRDIWSMSRYCNEIKLTWKIMLTDFC